MKKIIAILLLTTLSLFGKTAFKDSLLDFGMSTGLQGDHKTTLFEGGYHHLSENGTIFGITFHIGRATSNIDGTYYDQSIDNLILKLSLSGGPTYQLTKNLKLITAISGGLSWIGKDDETYSNYYDDYDMKEDAISWQEAARDELSFHGGVLVRLNLQIDHNFTLFIGVRGGGTLLFGKLHKDQKMMNYTIDGLAGASILF